MKFAVAVLIGAAQAISLNDAPPYFDEPDWRETFPSAAGLVQMKSACAMAGAAGVSCLEENNLFASGMLGDEDLGEDITMHGNPYRFI